MKHSAFLGSLVLAAVVAAPALAAPPRPPDVLRLRALDGAIEVSWVRSPDDPLYVSGYEVVRSQFPTGPYDRVCMTMKGAGACMDRRVQPEKTYYYRVRSRGIGDDGVSDFTPEMRIETPSAPPRPER